MNTVSKVFLGLLSIFITCLTPVRAEIVDTIEISDVLQHATDDAIVLVNISDTLYAPPTTLTNNLWRIYFTKQVHEILGEKDPEAAEELINQVKHTIVTQFPKKPVEPNTADVIASLSNKGILVLGITKKRMSAPYADNFGEITHQHLLHIGIDLEKLLVNPTLSNKVETASYSYGWGILFTNHQAEGPALKAFIEAYVPQAKKIVMIDNSLKALESVSNSVKDSGIAFTGLHYKRCDDLVQSFDPNIGTIQFFSHIYGYTIPSDEEAKKIKDEATEIDFAEILKGYIELWYQKNH